MTHIISLSCKYYQKKEGRYLAMNVSDNIEETAQKVYDHVKCFMDKHGFTPTVNQISDELHMMEHEVRAAINKLQQSDKIVIIEEPRKTTIKIKG
jgi:DNA-directed RNA polymerase specialized sigma subunit